jgi:Lrp/AsnC family leucine-responsive transcriptional regulator
VPDASVDPTDFQILALLQEDGRRAVSDMAGRVALSSTAVKRRIERLEAAGVITGYSARLDYSRLGWHLSAFVELRFEGTTTPQQMDKAASGIPEVTAIYTTAGDFDVIALVRAKDVDHLREVIHRLRASGRIVGTRTHVILQAHVKDDWRPNPPG